VLEAANLIQLHPELDLELRSNPFLEAGKEPEVRVSLTSSGHWKAAIDGSPEHIYGNSEEEVRILAELGVKLALDRYPVSEDLVDCAPAHSRALPRVFLGFLFGLITGVLVRRSTSHF
jgi:hypothetical protein